MDLERKKEFLAHKAEAMRKLRDSRKSERKKIQEAIPGDKKKIAKKDA